MLILWLLVYVSLSIKKPVFESWVFYPSTSSPSPNEPNANSHAPAAHPLLQVDSHHFFCLRLLRVRWLLLVDWPGTTPGSSSLAERTTGGGRPPNDSPEGPDVTRPVLDMNRSSSLRLLPCVVKLPILPETFGPPLPPGPPLPVLPKPRPTSADWRWRSGPPWVGENDWSIGSRPIVSRGGSASGLSLQTDMNWSRKSRSYLRDA
jgi:hypothetical protein